MRYFSSQFIVVAFFILCFSILACSSENYKKETLFSANPVAKKNIWFESLQLEAIQLDSIASSYVGIISIGKDSIRFIDKKYNWIFVFDKNGKFYNRHLGKGRGAHELPLFGIKFYCRTPEGGYFFIGGSYRCHYLTGSYERVNSYVMNWNSNTPVKLLQEKPYPANSKSYSLAYYFGRIKSTDNYIFLPLIGASPPYGVFNISTDIYAKKGRILAKMKRETGVFKDIIGRLSPIYSNNEAVRLFPFFFFDIINKNKIAITYAVDSLIYIFDLNFKTNYASFGFSGKNMDDDYIIIPSTENEDILESYAQKQLRERGYYTSLIYIEERDMYFRGYTKGGDSKTDGLQIYKDYTLIADVSVPEVAKFNGIHTFRVTGYIDPYFYSNAFINAKTGEIILYRFRVGN